jgi:hypothetical protein
MPRIGPHSRPDKLQIVDGRLAEAKLMARVRAELTQHLGGSPSATQSILIDRAAALSLRIHLMDRECARTGEMSERNGRQYLAWNNSLTRTMSLIGLEGTVARSLTPSEALAGGLCGRTTLKPSGRPPTPSEAISPGGLLDLPSAFEGPSWDRWRAVLKAAWGETLTPAEEMLFREVAERDPPTRPVKELWACVGRSGGKDSVASAIAVTAALKGFATRRPGEKTLVRRRRSRAG